MTPAEDQGPYYVPSMTMRRDITEGQVGIPTVLVFRVVRASDCSPVQGALVDIWHTEHLGIYSGFLDQGTVGETWLRGAQFTDANGLAFFRSIFPGCVHVKVFPNISTVFITQLFFPNRTSDEVFQQAPYDVHGPRPIRNEQDTWFHPENVFRVQKLAAPGAPGSFRLLAGITVALA